MIAEHEQNWTRHDRVQFSQKLTDRIRRARVSAQKQNVGRRIAQLLEEHAAAVLLNEFQVDVRRPDETHVKSSLSAEDAANRGLRTARTARAKVVALHDAFDSSACCEQARCPLWNSRRNACTTSPSKARSCC